MMQTLKTHSEHAAKADIPPLSSTQRQKLLEARMYAGTSGSR